MERAKMHVTKTATLALTTTRSISGGVGVSYLLQGGEAKHAPVREETDLAAFLAAVEQPTE